jgi:hypothetical protein
MNIFFIELSPIVVKNAIVYSYGYSGLKNNSLDIYLTPNGLIEYVG